MSLGLIKAYEIIVLDFENNLRNTKWWQFKKYARLKNNLEYFKEKLEKALIEENENNDGTKTKKEKK